MIKQIYGILLIIIFFFANDIGIKSINHNYDIEIIFSHICNLISMLTPSSAYNYITSVFH
jgi:hypothetical protein